MPRAAFVINPRCVPDLARFRRRCLAAGAAGGWELSFSETTEAEAGCALAREAVAAGAGLVFAAGGDGTVRACAQAVAGTGVPLAVVPVGTGNLAARALGVPARVGAALAVGFGGGDRRIDLACADGMVFTTMAGMGLDAEVVGGTPVRLKRRAGWASYALAGIGHLAGRAREFTLRLDGGPPFTRWARSVVVGNAGLLPGGFVLLPGARLDDGLLDVGVLAASSAPDWAVVTQRVLARSHHDARQLERHRARRVDIEAAEVLARQADGEIIAAGRTLTVTVLPGALIARAPLAGRSGRWPRHRSA